MKTKDLYKRFNIKIDLTEAQEKFRNKINNILFHGLVFNNGSEGFNLDDLSWDFANKLSLEYESYHEFDGYYLSDGLSFEEYLFRIQCLLDLLLEQKLDEQYSVLVGIIAEAIEESSLNLGIRLKVSKKDCAQICFAGSKLLDEKLIDDVLGCFEEKGRESVKIAFEKGLREFFESKRNPEKLKNCIRDMQLACDELMHYVFKDNNIGLKHLFKDDRWQKVGLNQYQMQIFWWYKEFGDKLAKHKVDAKIDEFDTENFIYLTGLLIRLILLKKDYASNP